MEGPYASPTATKDLSAIFARMGAALVVTGPDGIVRLLNPAAEKLIARAGDLVNGQPIMDFLVPENERRRWDRPFSECPAQGRGEVLSFSGRNIPVEYRISPLPTGHLFTLWDCTSRARDAHERARQCDEARHANRTKDEFLAMLSHELRTPMNIILSWTEILSKESGDPSLLQQGLDALRRNAEIQVDLINDLLDISRIITGKFEMHPQSTDVAEVAQAAVDSLRFSARDKNVRVAVNNKLGNQRIACDPSRLQQIIWNLVSNAIKFAPGGEVRVELNPLPDWVEISVKDTGEGIDPAFLPHVFERFWQGAQERVRKHGGLGLGLAIVRQLVELHGGRVSAHSEGLGRGAAFCVRLPALPAEHLPRERPPSAPARGEDSVKLRGLRILYVDDSPDSRAVGTLLLERHGAEVTTAASAAEALQSLSGATPDLLLSDIGMPDEDGLSLIRKIRASCEERKRQIPAAALTAYAREEEHREAIEAGFDAHITKPIDPQHLVRTLSQLAGR